MLNGLLPDRVPESVVAARCFVAQADGGVWPPRARQFLSQNFLDMGRLRAAGQWIQPDGTFSIAVPGRYVVLNETRQATGTRAAASPASLFEPSMAFILRLNTFRVGRCIVNMADRRSARLRADSLRPGSPAADARLCADRRPRAPGPVA